MVKVIRRLINRLWPGCPLKTEYREVCVIFEWAIGIVIGLVIGALIASFISFRMDITAERCGSRNWKCGAGTAKIVNEALKVAESKKGKLF